MTLSHPAHPLRRAIIAAGLFVALAFPAGAGRAETILFVGNSFTYGARSPVWKYRAASVTDLNGEGVGGAPALFKLFTQEAGLTYEVSLETVGGKGLDYHLEHKAALLDRPWDHVILQSYSTLDEKKPGDPAQLIVSSAAFAKMFRARNPKADIRLMATWSRADQTYQPNGHWFGKPITAMALDVRAGYDRAAAATLAIGGVLPVGQAWNRAIATGMADPNPYDGTSFGQVDLWAYDHYHASAYGYYLEALVVFGAVTGRDPASLGAGEIAAVELGLSPDQAVALQKIARDELAAQNKSR